MSVIQRIKLFYFFFFHFVSRQLHELLTRFTAVSGVLLMAAEAPTPGLTPTRITTNREKDSNQPAFNHRQAFFSFYSQLFVPSRPLPLHKTVKQVHLIVF